MNFNTHAHNSPKSMYCPSFMADKFQLLDLSFTSRQFYLSHSEPGHHFSASIPNKIALDFRKSKTNDQNWLWYLLFNFSPNTTIQILNQNQFAVNFCSPDGKYSISAMNDALLFSTYSIFDSFHSIFQFSLGKPMKFEAIFTDYSTSFQCVVTSSNEASSQYNSFVHSYESENFSISNAIVFSPSSISQFILASSISLKYSFYRLGCTALLHYGNLAFSSAFKYRKGPLKFGVLGRINQAPNNCNEHFHYKLGFAYQFTKIYASKFILDRHFCSATASIKYNNNLMEPGIMFKYDEPHIGFKFNFKTD